MINRKSRIFLKCVRTLKTRMIKLNEYNNKRNFKNTGEPEGLAAKTRVEENNLRFVVQHHIATRDHFDFRLEFKGVLLSWAVPKGPSYNPQDKRLAIQVEDHPLEYRNFEGLIPKGQYGAGPVMIWDEGYYNPLSDFNNLVDGSLKFTLHGKRLKGNWALVKIKQDKSDAKNNWLLVKEKDSYTGAVELSMFNTSIRTGKTMEEIKSGIK